MRSDRVKGNLDLLLLSALTSGPAHGYEVIAMLKRNSEGQFDLPEGTVYPSLHRLEAGGLLSSSWDDSGSRRRRVYRITAKGRQELRAERAAWGRFSRGMSAVLEVRA
ncbi:MAG: PadR family transcriptional regulator [Nocardioidaceae bacterium]